MPRGDEECRQENYDGNGAHGAQYDAALCDRQGKEEGERASRLLVTFDSSALTSVPHSGSQCRTLPAIQHRGYGSIAPRRPLEVA